MTQISAQACFLTTDLSQAFLCAKGRGASWKPQTPQNPEEPMDAMTLRARASEAAQWVASQTRRLALVCVDTAETQCAWIKAPSADPMVVAAAVRASGQDWGDRFLVGSVQPLVDPNQLAPAAGPKRKPFASWTRPIGASPAMLAPVRGPVIAAPLGLVRVWLDELDARGLRPERIASLWHCLACAWNPPGPGELAAVILFEHAERAVWTWSRGSELEAGGQQALEKPATPLSSPASTAAASASVAGSSSPEPSESEISRHESQSDPRQIAARFTSRLALDWLAWGTHAGGLPKRVTLVGTDVAMYARAMSERWPTIEIVEQRTPDPLASTLERAASALAADRAAGDDPRRTLTTLTSRPTRAVRTQYRWVAAALVLLAIAVAGLGWRFTRAGAQMSEQARLISEQSGTLVQSLQDPKLATSRNLVMSLSSMLVELRKKEPPKLPPAPKPVYEEVRRIAEILGRHEGTKILALSIDTRGTSNLQVTVPDRRTGEEIKLDLQRGAGALAWAEAAGGSTEQQLRLNGTWTR